MTSFIANTTNARICISGGKVRLSNTFQSHNGGHSRHLPVYNYCDSIVNIHSKNNVRIDFLCLHGVLPKTVECTNNRLPCKLKLEKHVVMWQKPKITPNSVAKCATFTVLDSKGAFFEARTSTFY